MNFAVKEYWLVNPKLKTIEVYVLEENKYKQHRIYKRCDNTISKSFDDLSVDLNDIFS